MTNQIHVADVAGGAFFCAPSRWNSDPAHEPSGAVPAFRLVHLGLSELHESRQPHNEAAV